MTYSKIETSFKKVCSIIYQFPFFFPSLIIWLLSCAVIVIFLCRKVSEKLAFPPPPHQMSLHPVSLPFLLPNHRIREQGFETPGFAANPIAPDISNAGIFPKFQNLLVSSWILWCQTIHTTGFLGLQKLQGIQADFGRGTNLKFGESQNKSRELSFHCMWAS